MSAFYDLYQTPSPDSSKPPTLHARILPSGTISADQLLDLTVKSSRFSRAVLSGVLSSVLSEMYDWLAQGYIVELGGLGYFSVSLKCDRYVSDPQEIRSPSIHFKDINLRLSPEVRREFEFMKLERKKSPYASTAHPTDEQKRELLHDYIRHHGAITRADYMRLTKQTKPHALDDLNRFVTEGMLKRFGRGKTVVYLE